LLVAGRASSRAVSNKPTASPCASPVYLLEGCPLRLGSSPRSFPHVMIAVIAVIVVMIYSPPDRIAVLDSSRLPLAAMLQCCSARRSKPPHKPAEPPRIHQPPAALLPDPMALTSLAAVHHVALLAKSQRACAAPLCPSLVITASSSADSQPAPSLQRSLVESPPGRRQPRREVAPDCVGAR
jgi:hypothetical protein